MADPLTLSVLGGAVLTQGVSFVYDQAGELLRRRRERREAGGEPEAAEPVEAGAEVLAGRPAPLVADPAALDVVAGEMARLRRELSGYADGVEEITPGDRDLLVTVDALRGLLEAVYGQRLTFRGEDREPSGPVVEGSVDVGTVLGRAVAVRGGEVSGRAHVRGEGRAERVEGGGEFVGVDIDRIDGR
ncbi:MULTISPECIES: hypothetical protein [Actinomadura]|uniref:Uncharacterized protein n=1 Tax=Actinomadura yumaensis TaxID=111807 RepID=A0ABW2CE60_9ACTN|nr:hypothetical protein [Actinomadura sp. J1-007]MWK38209.1 hypothetical protein [Actinomadura sp. J1-007]